MATPNHLDIRVYQGENLDLTLPLLDSAGQNVPAATGYTARMQIRDKRGGTTLVDTLVQAAGITLAAGSARLTRSVAQVLAYAVGAYVYDLILTETATGKATVWYEGAFTVVQTITQP